MADQATRTGDRHRSQSSQPSLRSTSAASRRSSGSAIHFGKGSRPALGGGGGSSPTRRNSTGVVRRGPITQRQHENVVVGVRVRPLLATEVEQGQRPVFVVERDAKAVLELDPENDVVANTHHFDHVFDEHTSSQEIFDECGAVVVERALEGFNGTLFCYGQTGTGKTHTLLGNEENPGVVLCSVYSVFHAIQQAAFSNFLVRMSFIEIYNEELRDLLSSDQSPSAMQRLKIAENPKTGPYVRNCVECVVSSADSIVELLRVRDEEVESCPGFALLRDRLSKH